MIKYIHGEIYRLLHKKTMYIYFTVLALGYVLLTYVRSGGFTDKSVIADAANFFFYLPILAGGFLFAAIYTDDLNSKNLISLVGFGLSKAKIVISKLILTSVFSAVIFALAPVLHIGVYSLLGSSAELSPWLTIYALSIKFWLTTIAFSALCGVVVYGMQRSTFAFVSYILLAFGIVGGLISSALSSFAPGITRFLMSGITDEIMAGIINGSSLVMPIAAYIIYIAASILLSALAFTKKEMEF